MSNRYSHYDDSDKYYGDMPFYRQDVQDSAYYKPGASTDAEMSAYAEKDGVQVYSQGIVAYDDAPPVGFLEHISEVGGIVFKLVAIVFDNLRFGGVVVDEFDNIQPVIGELNNDWGDNDVDE